MPPYLPEFVDSSVAKSVDISSPPGPARPRWVRGVGLFFGTLGLVGRKRTILNATGVFPQDSLSKYLYVTCIILCGSWVRHPEALRRVQVMIDVHNRSVFPFSGALELRL